MDNQTQLKKLHNSLLELLSEFDRVCKKHSIQYFLDSGTALGAIRHGGFIPWDDDADVGMLRSEYERFIKIAPFELSNKFVIQNRSNDPQYFKHHAKLRILGTYFPEEFTDKFKYQGIFIDIFPFDYVSEYTIIRQINFFLIKYFRSRSYLKRFKNARNTTYRKCLGKILDLIPESVVEFPYNLLTSYRKRGKNITCYEYWVCQHKLKIFKTDWLKNSTDITFENKSFLIMKNYDAYLKKMYNNYMNLPPKEKRVYHCNGKIRFSE